MILLVLCLVTKATGTCKIELFIEDFCDHPSIYVEGRGGVSVHAISGGYSLD